jgi:hypothetical protein
MSDRRIDSNAFKDSLADSLGHPYPAGMTISGYGRILTKRLRAKRWRGGFVFWLRNIDSEWLTPELE